VLQKFLKAKAKEITEAEKKYKITIVTSDDLIYFADDFKIEGDFVRFTPKYYFSKMKSTNMAEMELILPSRQVKEILVRK
jgi:hypothetical protein